MPPAKRKKNLILILIVPFLTETRKHSEHQLTYYTKLAQHVFNANLINVVLINVYFRQKRILKDIN